jgi:GntR family transcriptional regulator
MFINSGARNLLLDAERQKFLGEEWPRIYATIQRLGLKAEDLVDASNRESTANTETPKKTESNPHGEER